MYDVVWVLVMVLNSIEEYFREIKLWLLIDSFIYVNVEVMEYFNRFLEVINFVGVIVSMWDKLF